MKRRLLIIGLALVLAVIGTSGVLAYVKQADARAITGMKAVSALVAQKLIPSGTSARAALRGGLLAAEKLPASSVPSGAVRSVTGALAPLVTSGAIQPGQLLLRAMLVKTAVRAPGGVTLPPGMIEVTIAFCLPEMVAGNVQAGSHVAVFDTVGTNGNASLSAGPACTGSHQQELGTLRTRVVLPRVQVMSVGTPSAAGSATPAPTSSTGSGQGSTLVTLAVSQANAERLIQLSETGLPYLALLTATSVTTADSGHFVNTGGIVVTPVVTHSSPAPTPTPTPAAAQPSPAPKPTVIIIAPCPAPTHPIPALPRLRPALTYPTPTLTAAAAIPRQK